MADTVVEELRAWAAEIARNKEGHATWKEDCRVLNQAAKEIENLREENKRLRRGINKPGHSARGGVAVSTSFVEGLANECRRLRIEGSIRDLKGLFRRRED